MVLVPEGSAEAGALVIEKVAGGALLQGLTLMKQGLMKSKRSLMTNS